MYKTEKMAYIPLSKKAMKWMPERDGKSGGDYVFESVPKDYNRQIAACCEIPNTGQTCQPQPWAYSRLLYDEEHRNGHQEDVDAGKVPNGFQTGIVARKMALHLDESYQGDKIPDRKRRYADSKQTAPAPFQREFHKIESQHDISGKSET